MTQDIDVYIKKVVDGQERLNAARMRLVRAAPDEVVALEREITILEAMLPVWRQFVSLLKAVSK